MTKTHHPILPIEGEKIIDTVRRVIKKELLAPTFNGDASTVYESLFLREGKNVLSLPFIGKADLPLIRRKDPGCSRKGMINVWTVDCSDIAEDKTFTSYFYDTDFQPGKHFWLDSLLVAVAYVEHELNNWLKYRSCRLRSINKVVKKTWTKDPRCNSWHCSIPVYLHQKGIYESRYFLATVKKGHGIETYSRDKNIEFCDEMAELMLVDIKITKQKIIELKEAIANVRIEMANGIK